MQRRQILQAVAGLSALGTASVAARPAAAQAPTRTRRQPSPRVAARDGVTLRATATLTHGGRRKATSRCEIELIDADGNAKLCAVAMGSALTTNA